MRTSLCLLASLFHCDQDSFPNAVRLHTYGVSPVIKPLIHPSLLLPLGAYGIRKTLQFLNLRQSVGLLGRGISPTQGIYL
jgi:hypothetical protein